MARAKPHAAPHVAKKTLPPSWDTNKIWEAIFIFTYAGEEVWEGSLLGLVMMSTAMDQEEIVIEGDMTRDWAFTLMQISDVVSLVKKEASCLLISFLVQIPFIEI